MAVDLESNLIRIKWVDHPDTGRPVRLIETEELKREFLEWLEQECSVHDGKLMRVTLSNGTEMVREQCTTCGKPIGTAVKRADVSDLDKLPFGNVTAHSDYERRRLEDLNELKMRHFRVQARAGWGSAEYRAYLQSDKWKLKRAAVLRRAHGICEGCGTAEAAVVHHHHYNNIYDEWLWDLVALCAPCHRLCHPEHREGDD